MAGRTKDPEHATEGGDERLGRAGRMAIAAAECHRSLLEALREELGDDSGPRFAAAAQRLAEDFGEVTATAVEAVHDGDGALEFARSPREEMPSLYRPGHMRRRLDQLTETHRRYGHPFALVVFDASGPGAKEGTDDDLPVAILSSVLRDSIRIVDEAFRLEEEAICVLAPNLRTIEAVQMAERLLGKLDELEQAGGLRIAVTAGAVACPDHGADADGLLHKADAAMWRARAVGQPIGVGGLQDR
ncbi:MAG TPA: diguanylate cyclase [Solirubrobacterales bacterium]|nr:diguanylate cyclase [Solirubrobacterales bacterium]